MKQTDSMNGSNYEWLIYATMLQRIDKRFYNEFCWLYCDLQYGHCPTCRKVISYG